MRQSTFCDSANGQSAGEVTTILQDIIFPPGHPILRASILDLFSMQTLGRPPRNDFNL